MHRLAAAYLILILSTLGCEKEPPPPPTTPSLPKNLLQPPEATNTTTTKEPGEHDGRDCEPPHRGLETVKVYQGLDQLTFPIYVPESYDPANPPPLLLFVPDRYFELSDWMKDAPLLQHAEKAGYVVGVVHRFTSQATGRDVTSAISSIKKKLCFDSKRVFAIGAGSGTKPVLEAACDGGVVAVVTSAGRPVVECARAEFQHLHFEHRKDKTLPSGGANPRALSEHESRIEDQKKAMSMAGIPLKRDILARQKEDGDSTTPCTPPNGAVDVDEFITSACTPLGCRDATPEKKDGCEVRRGHAALTVCTVNAGRIWTPTYPPFEGCYGDPDPKYGYLDRTFAFLGASQQ